MPVAQPLVLLPFLLLSLLPTPARGDLRLPAILSDGMVLQQDRPARLWGWADAGATVEVRASWQAEPAETRVAADGTWTLEIETPAAGGPYEVSVSAGGQTHRIRDVLVGEVWICSGQSNMQMGLRTFKGVPDADEVIAAADDDALRFFTVRRAVATEPRVDCAGSWQPTNPESIEGFSAAGYFYAAALRRERGVPVGMLHASWGGTRAEAWTHRDALRDLGGYEEELAVEYLDRTPEREAAERAQRATRQKRIEELRVRPVAPDRAQSAFDDSEWKTIELPATWESAGFPELDGVAWFRRAVTIPAAWAGRELVLELGAIDDEDRTWLDGHEVGGIGAETPGHWRVPRRYTIPADRVAPGQVVLAVRVLDIGGDGGLIGPAERMLLRPADGGGDAISLTGTWRWWIETRLDPPAARLVHANAPSALYNAMIHPLRPYRIRGAIWYQGESNHRVGRAYRRLFPGMIRDWRARWGQGDFPFYYVQIAPFAYGVADGAPLVREAQLMTLAVPNTGMIVTTDIAEPDDIHPRDKRSVGERLARWALVDVYGREDVVRSGPLYAGSEVEGARVRIRFTETGGGLRARGGDLTDFEIAGSDRRFVPARAAIDGETVLVQSPDVPAPVAVRFGWSNTACPNLFNAAGLPASPFRTDDW